MLPLAAVQNALQFAFAVIVNGGTVFTDPAACVVFEHCRL
jgi:hypothetical protein